MEFRSKIKRRKIFPDNISWQANSTGQGFTMMEMAIVLTVIALIIGSIFAAKSAIISFQLNKARSLSKASIVNGFGSDLSLWLDSTSPSAFSSSPSNNSAISNWIDVNPNDPGRNTVTSAGTNRPTYKTKILNNLPMLRFDGSNDYLYNASPANLPINNNSRTIFLVIKNFNVNSTNWNFVLHYGTAATLQSFDISLGGNAILSNSVGVHLFFWDRLITNPIGTNAAIISITYRRSSSDTLGTALSYYLNGTYYAATGGRNVGSNATLATTSTELSIGARSSGGVFSEYTAVDIGEVIIIDRFLSDEERKQVEAYLSKKWSIAVS